MFSDRTNWKLAQNRLTLALEDARARGEKILDLTVSNPTRVGLRYDAAAIVSALGSVTPTPAAKSALGMAHPVLDYDPQAKGLPAAREAVADYYRLEHGVADVDAERIVLTTSTSEGYSFVFRLLCNAGDELLVPKPSYPLFEFLADLQDVKLVPYPLIYDHGWQMDFPSLQKAVTPRTRGVVVVHPNNPTGSYVKHNEVAQLNAFCRGRGLAVIVDEVFLDYVLGTDHVGTATPEACPERALASRMGTVEQSSTVASQAAAPQGLKAALQGHVDRSAGSAAPTQDNRAIELRSNQPNGRSNQYDSQFDPILTKKQVTFAKNNDVLTFTLSGLSKISALPQMKVAWVVTSGPGDLVDAAMARLEVIADTYLSMNAPVQWAVPVLLEQRANIQRQLLERVCANLSELDRQLAAQKLCSRLHVEGGWYAVLRVPVTQSDEELAIALVREKQVLVHPGHFYDFPSDGYLVVSLIAEESEFAQGVGRALSHMGA